MTPASSDFRTSAAAGTASCEPSSASNPASASSPAADDFRTLIALACAGDAVALERVIERHGDDLLRVVRRRMPRRLRTMFDSQDFVQAFWATFFAHGIGTARFETPDDLRAYLCAVAANRVTDQVRKRLVRPTRNLNREKPLTPAVADSRPGRTETPSQVAIAHERLDELLRDQQPRHRRIIELKMTGASNAEIAATLGMNEGSIRRVLTKAAARARIR